MSTTIDHDEAMYATSGTPLAPIPPGSGFGGARHRCRPGHRPSSSPRPSPPPAPPSRSWPARPTNWPNARVAHRSAGGMAAAAVADVTDRRGLGAAVADLRGRWGRSTCSSTTPASSGRSARSGSSTLDEWWTTMEVNVRGIVLCSQLVLPDMVARRSRPDHQHHQPGRRPPLAARVGVLGLEGRRHQADREPRPGDEPLRHRRVQRAPRVCSRSGCPRPSPPTTPRTPHEAHIRALGPQRACRGPGSGPRPCGRADRCGSPPVTPTASRAATSPFTTTSTPSWPDLPRSARATSTSCAPIACRPSPTPLTEPTDTTSEETVP